MNLLDSLFVKPPAVRSQGTVVKGLCSIPPTPDRGRRRTEDETFRETLDFIDRRGACTSAELAEHLDVFHTTASRTLSRMREQGLVTMLRVGNRVTWGKNG